MKLNITPTRRALTGTFLLLFCLFAGGAACRSAGQASARTEPGGAENQKRDDRTAAASSKYTAAESASNEVSGVEGLYQLNNHRPGAEGYENSLTVTAGKNGRITVSFEGTFFYRANGAETFHESSAGGELKSTGNTASGRLVEEGSENGCSVELNFAGEKLNLKSKDCDLNVMPDGVYRKNAGKTGDFHGDIPEERDNTMKSPSGDAKPYIQYDAAGAPNGVVNLMATDDERLGCGDDILPFSGKVMSVESPNDFVYEFTLAAADRKRQKISLVVSADDGLAPADLRSIIRIGNNLEVTYINCGNAPIASPTAIYKQ